MGIKLGKFVLKNDAEPRIIMRNLSNKLFSYLKIYVLIINNPFFEVLESWSKKVNFDKYISKFEFKKVQDKDNILYKGMEKKLYPW